MAIRFGGTLKRYIRAVGTVTVLVVAISLAATYPAHAYGYLPDGAKESEGKIAVLIDQLSSFSHSLVTNENAKTKSEGAAKFCASLESESCTADAKANLKISAVLPVCSNIQEACIESVKISQNGGPLIDAKPIRQFGGLTFPSVAKYKTQQGSSASLWQSTSADRTLRVVVSPVLTQSLKRGKTTTEDFHAEISAVDDWYDSKFKAPHLVSYNFDGDIVPLVETGDLTTGQCAAIDDGYCAKKIEFPADVKIALTVRLPNTITGWLHGRLKESSINVAPVDSNYNRVTVSASPVEVPQMYTVVDTSKANTTMKKNLGFWHTRGGRVGENTWHVYPSTSWVANYLVKNLAIAAGDTAVSTKTIWSFDTLGNSEISANKCLVSKTKLIGLVSTNAMAYSGGAPIWRGGALNYEVSGLHYLPGGVSVTEGTYDLAIRSEVARCLYGFSKAPISASISVTGSRGERKVATTTVTERNGWLKLAAYGFTFSSPKIVVKIKQKNR